MFSDTYKVKLVDEVIYEVTGKLVTRSQGDIQIEGFNPSAEEADEGTESAVESGVDVVLNHRLVETYAFGDKKSYTLYLKDYMKKWVIVIIPVINRDEGLSMALFSFFCSTIVYHNLKFTKRCDIVDASYMLIAIAWLFDHTLTYNTSYTSSCQNVHQHLQSIVCTWDFHKITIDES